MKFCILLVCLTYLNCPAHNVASKNDTLFKKENVMLFFDNGFSLLYFAVSGDIYLTNQSFIFHPKPYRRKRFDMYNDLVKDLVLPYDSIVMAKRRGIFVLKLKTKAKKYKISDANNWGKNLRAMIMLMNRLRREHKGE